MYPLKTTFLRTIAIAAIAAAAIATPSQPLLHAVPENRRETFAEALSPQTWTLTEGRPGNASVLPDAKRLLLSPGIDDASTPASRGRTTLRYRFYPLRSMKPRPAFGDFVAQVRIEAGSQAAPLGFALLDAGDWQLRIEYEASASRARLVLRGQGDDNVVETGDWVALPGMAGGMAGAGDVALAFVRRGDRVEARIGKIKNPKRATPEPSDLRVIGHWQGRLAPIVDFALQAKPLPPPPPVAPATAAAATAAAHPPHRIVSLTIDPLPADGLYFQVDSRPGAPLPGDAALKNTLRDIGGDYLGGYLWPRNSPEARLSVRIGNSATDNRSGILEIAVADWQDQPAAAPQRIPVTLVSGEQRQMDIALPADRYGYFTARLALATPEPDAAPVGAPATIGYGITAAPRAAEMGNANRVGTHGAPWALGGNKWVRFWDFGGRAMHWSGIQTTPDRWDWTMLDAAVQRSEEAGLAPPLVVLGMTPEWAATEPERGTYRGKGAYSPPKDIAGWAEYCRRVAARYKGRVTHYEIWNEPNGNRLGPRGFFFHGPVESYLELVRAAHAAVKSVDPAAKILAPSGTGHFFPFLKRFLELGGGDFCDIISIHTYTTPFPPEIGYHFNSEKSYAHRVGTVRRIMAETGVKKPVWNTEIGYHSGLDLEIAGVPVRQDQIAAEALPGHWPDWTSGWSFRPLDPRRATAFFARFLILSPVYGVDRMFIHHRLMATNTADASPFMPAPAVGWYSRLLGDADFVRSHAWHEDVQAHEFRRADGRHVVAFWRVEKETLRMGTRDERKLGQIESAPVAGIAGIADQKPVAAAPNPGRPPRATYFEPGRTVPVSLVLNERPAALFDLWGNELPLPSVALAPASGAAPAAVNVPLGEAPVYAVYEKSPDTLRAKITEGIALPEPAAPRPVSGSGRLSPPAAPTVAPAAIPASIREMIPGLVPLWLDQAVVRPAKMLPTQVHLGGGEAIAWKIPASALPAGASRRRARIVLAVRGGGFRYDISLNENPVESRVWPAWPARELSRGKGWVEQEVVVMSEPVTLHENDLLTITAARGNSRLYNLWLLPEASEAPTFGMSNIIL
ncbi:MAG: hypothetical protein LBK99_00090 [Opitutaceae bacterium]|nr:hypothetical protein [Opitutaceae bacterium]